MYPAVTGWVAVPGGGRCASSTHCPCRRLDLVDTRVPGDRPVLLGAQRDDAGRVLPRRLPPDLPVDDRVGPLAVDVEVVGGRVEVPGAHAGRPAADLAELQPLRAEEPLHVRGAGADPERLVDALPQLAQLLVVGHRVDPVGGQELRRDPAGRASPRARSGSSGTRSPAPGRRRPRGCRRSPRAPRRTPRRRWSRPAGRRTGPAPRPARRRRRPAWCRARRHRSAA